MLPSFVGQRRKAVDLGPVDASPLGQYVVATFLADPEQGEVSRRAAYVRNNGVAANLPSFTIMSNRCTHVGCPTQPNGPLFPHRRQAVKTSGGEVGLVPAQAAGFGCPCHGSQFDGEGNRTAGPAPRALDRYEFSIRNGRLWLGGLYSVGRVEGTGAGARIAAFKLRATACRSPAPSRSSTRSIRSHDRLRARHPCNQPDTKGATDMKRFSLRHFALGIALGAVGAAAVLAASSYATPTKPARTGSSTAALVTRQQSPDQVIRWNRILLAILRTPGAQPPTIHATRSMAMMHAAVYDAVNAIVATHAEYLVHLKAPRHASVAAAAATAAHGVLVRLFPSQSPVLDADLADSLAQVPDGAAKDQGVKVGQEAAGKVVALRSEDGSAATPIPFTPGTNPGDYQPTPPAFVQPVFTHWRFVKPFALRSADQFRPGPPPEPSSSAYTAAFDEVKGLGSIGSTSRTADQTEIGRFWNAPIQNYWNEIAQTIALEHGTTLPQNARLFALLDLTIADSVIAFYDGKYTYHFWRPVTAIRAADTDGNPATVGDPGWTPLATTALDPSYPGAHSVVSSAGAAVLGSFFGGDSDTFAVSSEVLPGVQRSFSSFSGVAEEAGLSRIYAGQHFRFDHLAGQKLGWGIAGYVLQHFLLPNKHGHKPKAPVVSRTARSSSAVGAAVAAARSPLGRILVGERGRTLYVFEKDKSSVSTCDGSCAKYWPPLTTTAKPRAVRGAVVARLGTARRKDGRLQVTYNRHPLYYFAGDAKAGQTRGQGMEAFGSEWYVLSPAGAKLETREA